MRLVAFDLHEIVAALFRDDPRGRPLAVQGVGGDDLSIQGGQALEQRGGGGLFAKLGAFLLIVDGLRLRGAVLVLGQGCGNVPARLWSQPVRSAAKGSGSMRVSSA